MRHRLFLGFSFLFVLLYASCFFEGNAPALTEPTSTPEPQARVQRGFQIDYGNDFQRAMDLTSNAGFGWVKLQIRWADMEQSRGKIEWTYLDRVVETAKAKKLKVLFSVTAAPTWARGPVGAAPGMESPPVDPATFAQFLSTLAGRYKGNGNAYEVWNEQNSNREWAGPNGVSAVEYVRMLKAVYPAIKAADAEAVVVAGALTPAGDVPGLSRDDVAYFKEMYAAGVSGSFDAVGVHASGFNNPPDLDPTDPQVLSRSGGFHNHRSFYFRNFERYHEVMEANGDGSKPLWFTEFGWASGNAPEEWGYAKEITEKQQAEYLTRAFQIAEDRPYVGAMFVWNLNFFGDDFAKQEFAVLKPNWSPRPSYEALAAMPGKRPKQ